jgi:hypothetical protein
VQEELAALGTEQTVVTHGSEHQERYLQKEEDEVFHLFPEMVVLVAPEDYQVVA